MIGRLFRPIRRWLARRGVRTAILKNPGEGGFAGFAASWREPDPARLMRCSLATVRQGGQAAYFLIADEDDLIQRELANGRFYEPEELAIIARHFAGGTFVDIGANIGNHAIHAGLLLGATRIVAIEPNPDMARLLQHNLALNGLGENATVHELGLSDMAGTGALALDAEHNAGAARMAEGEGNIRLVTGDSLLAHESPAFLKIDTEGFEVKVLQGLAGTLEQHRPVIFIEVEDGNLPQVEALVGPLGYREIERFARYPGLANYLYKVDGAAGAQATNTTQANG